VETSGWQSTGPLGLTVQLCALRVVSAPVPIEVVEQCAWLDFRFALSYRNVEEVAAK